MQARPKLLTFLMNAYNIPDAAHACGSIIRQLARQEQLCKAQLEMPDFLKFFDYVNLNTFEIASDAFATFNLILTKHKKLCSTFLTKNFDLVPRNVLVMVALLSRLSLCLIAL